MTIKNLIDEDFVNYKKPSMFIAMPNCSFKCDKECGEPVCQNSELAAAPSIEMDDYEIWTRYAQNPITEAIVFGGLEPFDSFEELGAFILKMRSNKENDDDTIVIYTGYYPEEIKRFLLTFINMKNIIIKFGRFIPNRPSRYDEVLGVELASDNQFAKRIEDLELDKWFEEFLEGINNEDK